MPSKKQDSLFDRREAACLAAVARELVRLDRLTVELEHETHALVERLPAERRQSARNLVHYVALRQHDLRELQLELAELGLSSLGRSESFVRGSLLAAARRAHEALTLRGDPRAQRELARIDAESAGTFGWPLAKQYLHEHTRELFGTHPDNRHIFIMITAPAADEATDEWMVKMLIAGMNALRINCAHEGPEEWQRVINTLAAARRETGKECRIFMDLAGPKIRTGSVAVARRIATWKPKKDELGTVTAPARVVVRRASFSRHDHTEAKLSLPDEAFASLRRGDELRFRDARGKKRAMS